MDVVHSSILNRDFCGFNEETGFRCRLVHNSRWDLSFQKREIKVIIGKHVNEVERIKKLVELFSAAIKAATAETPRPDVLIVVLPAIIIEKASSASVARQFSLRLQTNIKGGGDELRRAAPAPLGINRHQKEKKFAAGFSDNRLEHLHGAVLQSRRRSVAHARTRPRHLFYRRELLRRARRRSERQVENRDAGFGRAGV